MTDRDDREALRAEIKALRAELDEAERRRQEEKARQDREYASKQARVRELWNKIEDVRPMSRQARANLKKGIQILGILLLVAAYLSLCHYLQC